MVNLYHKMCDIDRKKPFSSLEKDLFLNIIQKYEDILSCKKTNSVSVVKKKHSWAKILNEYNSSPIVSQKASTKQLTKLWYNIKAKAREAKTKENVRFMTGGGLVVDDMNPVDAKVMDIDKNILTNVQVDVDSDINGQLTIQGDNNDEAWSKTSISYVVIPDLPDNSPGTQISWNVSQPSTSTQNYTEEKERTAIKTPMKKSSFGEKYINKIDILKIKILEEELKHQEEMHKVELTMKLKEKEFKEKLWEMGLKIKERELTQLE
ncbi:hypothetical protein HW555_010992 [Spodoptera exigua]|uniref:Myb/SANT-like DNA-binding domain-containing protein 3 n=1 Tax=Spodoptera exigua TaxID=7107 RepID=A0A835G7W7_SPOEX|nr:hypothetical protein HW555_010992 [Spodoptera exigua]